MTMFRCSSCGYEKAVPPEYAGKRATCPKCKTQGRVASNETGHPSKTTAKPVVKFHCPLCDQKMGVASEQSGKKVRCPKCQNPVTVPESVESGIAEQPQAIHGLQLKHELPATDEAPAQRQLQAEVMDDAERQFFAAQKRREDTMSDEGEGTCQQTGNVTGSLLAVAAIIVAILGLVATGAFLAIAGKPPKEPDVAAASRFGHTYLEICADPNSPEIRLRMGEEMRSGLADYKVKAMAAFLHQVKELEFKEGQEWFDSMAREYGYALIYGPVDAQDGKRVSLYVQSAGDKFMIHGMKAEGGEGGELLMTSQQGQAIEIGTREKMGLSWRDRAGPTFWVIAEAVVVLSFLMIECCWYVLFKKLGYPAWLGFIPLVNLWYVGILAEKPKWAVILVAFTGMMPVANIWMLQLWGEPVTLASMGIYPIAGAIVCVGTVLWISMGIAEQFEKGILWGVGLWLLPWIFYPALAFLSE